MAIENLTESERTAVARLLRETIARDNYPLSPRIRTLTSALTKLDPEQPAAPEPYPAPAAWVNNSSIGQRKRR